jgi:putative flavoprotein involved in K+ transport
MNTQRRMRYTHESAAECYIEEGTAFIDLCGATAAALMKGDVPIGREIRPLTGALRPERFTVIVLGGGQAGLSVGHHLHRRGISFVILDQNGAQDSTLASRGSTSPCSTTRQTRSTSAASSPASRGSTSLGCSSSMRRRRR